jgi:hypothetical protein
MYEYEYRHTGIDSKGQTHVFWSLCRDLSLNKQSHFDGVRWLKNCVSTGTRRKYQEPEASYSSPNSYAFYN